MKEIITTSAYCKAVFGEKLYKLTLSAATGCPNRENGKPGCAFCSAGGSGEFAAPRTLSYEQQVSFALSRVRDKYKGGRFIAYFQSYTGTYGDLERLREIYFAAAGDPRIAAISIATRPDCLGEKEMALLRELASLKPLWVELGLQTENDETAAAFGRGYPTKTYIEATEKLRTLNAHIITHIILGLPGETGEQMLRSAALAAGCGDGVKLQLLHILKGTAYADAFARGKIAPMPREDYFETLADILATLPERTVLHRLTGDGDKKLLLAPLWSGDKKRVLNDLTRHLSERGIVLIR